MEVCVYKHMYMKSLIKYSLTTSFPQKLVCGNLVHITAVET